MTALDRIDNRPVDTDQTTDAGQFVRVLHDPDTGRTIIALNDAATNALDGFLDSLDLQDVLHDSGLPQDQLDQQVDVLGAIRGALHKHLRGW